jgi:fructose/tagatose bisphosphate aldolase
MPIATTEQHRGMLDGATAGGYALAGVNVSSSETLNAALCEFAEAHADGILQVSTGGGEFLSGTAVKDMVAGARALGGVRPGARRALPGARRAAHRPLLARQRQGGQKKAHDPRSWGREAAMTTRVAQACEQLGSAGRSLRR